MKSILSFTCICVFALLSCKRDYKSIADYTPVDSSLAYLKIVHVSPNFRQVFGTRDTFNVYVDGQKINSTALTYNSVYPFSVNSSTSSITATYAGIAAGQKQVRLSVPGVSSPDSATILTLSKTMEPGKFYTLMITDSIKSTLDSSKIFIKDLIPMTLPGYLNVRFVNAAMNDTAGKNVDIVSYARNANLFGNVKPGTVTGFSLLSFNQSVADTLYVTRPATSGTPLSQRIVLAKLPLNSAVLGSGSSDKRSYTVYYKGDANLTSGTKARALAVYINQ